MKTKTYRFGKISCKAYMKTMGNGYECGFHFGGDQTFVGNFIHAKEANQWWTLMNKEIRKFTGKYWVGETFPKTWYKNFLKHHLFKCYYNYLDKAFKTYNRSFTTAFNKDYRTYSRIRRQKDWTNTDKLKLRSKAA